MRRNRSLTDYGKAVRKYRIEADVTMKDMADYIQVSSAYLSAVEVGLKNPSDELVEKTIHFFHTNNIDASDLTELSLISRSSIEVVWEHMNIRDKQLLRSFATTLPKLSQEEKQEFRDWLEKSGG